MPGDLAREKGQQDVGLIFNMAAGETDDWNVCIRSSALHPGCLPCYQWDDVNMIL
jgi:hypothetical protein